MSSATLTANEAAPAAACPGCGAAAEPDQLVCVECGGRLALDWQRPPSWRLPAAIVGVVVALAGAGLAFALTEIAHNAGKGSPVATTAASQPPASQPAAAPTATTPTATAPTTTAATPTSTAPTTSTPSTTPAPSAGAVASWPAGKSAYTVVLASTKTRADAESRASSATKAGIPGVGVLHSDDYPSLRPGYWVVFAGQFATSGEADSNAGGDAGKGFPGAYVRYVSQQSAKPANGGAQSGQ